MPRRPGGRAHGEGTRTLLVIKTAEGRRTTPCDVSDEQYEAVRERLREMCDHEPSV